MHLHAAVDAPARVRIGFDDFLRVDIRIGTIVAAENFPKARKPSYRLGIDLGLAIGEKKSCAQIVANYTASDLIGRQVAAVVNFPLRPIGPAMSEVLTMGLPMRRAGWSCSRPIRPFRRARGCSRFHCDVAC